MIFLNCYVHIRRSSGPWGDLTDFANRVFLFVLGGALIAAVVFAIIGLSVNFEEIKHAHDRIEAAQAETDANLAQKGIAKTIHMTEFYKSQLCRSNHANHVYSIRRSSGNRNTF